MQKFRNSMSDGWLFTQELRYFRNFMRNWDRDVEDCDFFDIFANGNNSSAARQSLYYLGGAVTNETRLNELEKESSLKKGGGLRIGF